MSEQEDYYTQVEEIEAVVRGFESCTTRASAFGHGAHLTVAFSYLHLSRLTVMEALERMRAGLYRYLDHHNVGRQKYNETMTLFWIKLIRGFLDRTDTSRPPAEIANEMIEACGKSQLVFDYFSREIISSEEARVGWVEPDMKPLDFKEVMSNE